MFLLFSLAASGWNDYYADEPNTTITKIITPDMKYDGNVYLDKVQAINFNTHVIKLSAKSQYNLLVEDSFFSGITKNYAGATLYWRANGNVTIVRTCGCKILSDIRYPGVLLFYVGSGNVNISYLSIFNTGSHEENAFNALNFMSMDGRIQYLNHSNSFSATGAYNGIRKTEFSYSNIQNNSLSEFPSHYDLIHVNTSYFHHLNIANNSFLRTVSACIVFQSETPSILENSYFIRNNCSNLVIGQKESNYKINRIFVDDDTSVRKNDVQESLTKSELRIIFLSTYLCEAEFKQEEARKSDTLLVATSATAGIVVGVAALGGIGFFIYKKLPKKSVSAKKSLNDDDEYTYEYSTAEEEENNDERDEEKKQEPKKVKIDHHIKDNHRAKVPDNDTSGPPSVSIDTETD